ncbi:MAG: carboxymuconolactone decarboxylase family protein [Rickettsiales bacterium]|jgi:alkylhydroperoxidase family enzyme
MTDDTNLSRIPFLSVEEAKRLGKEHGVPSSMAHLNVFRVMLHHPELAAATSNLLATLLYKGNKLDARLRELIIMRLAWRTGSVYEWTQHWRVAAALDIDAESVLAVRDWQNATCLNDADKAVLAATDETLDHGRISDATWEDCCRHIASEAERIELVLAISNWRLFSEMFQSLRIPLEEGVDHWPPDGLPSPAAE